MLSAGVDIGNPTRSRSFDKNSPAYEKTPARRKSVGVCLKCLGLEPRADDLVQSVLTPGVTDLSPFTSYDQLMDHVEQRINIARAIFNTFGRKEGNSEYSDGYIAKGFMAVLRYGNAGKSGINPKATKDFGYWKIFFETSVTHADLDAIKEAIEQVDNMNQSLSPVTPFSENTGKVQTIQEQQHGAPKKPSVTGCVQDSHTADPRTKNGKGGRASGGRGGRFGNRPATRQDGGDVQPSKEKCSFCGRRWCTPNICNPDGKLVKVLGNDGVLLPNVTCWNCGQFGHMDGQCTLDSAEGAKMLNFYDDWWRRTKPKRSSRVRSTNAAQSLSEAPSSTAPTYASAPAASATPAAAPPPAPPQASPNVPLQVPQVHPGWLAPPPAYALPAPGSGVLPHPAVGAAASKPPDTKTIKLNGELYQKV